MKCQICGTENTEGKQFCDMCGATLKESAVPVAQAPAAAPPAPWETEIEPWTLGRLITKLRRRPVLGCFLLIIVIVIVLFAALVLFTFVYVWFTRVDINVRNGYDETIYLATYFYDDNEEAWITKGWTVVRPGETSTVRIWTSRTEFFMYAELLGGTSSLLETADSVERIVTGDAFSYRGAEWPEGKRRRTVKFTRCPIKKGIIGSVVDLYLGP
jgi:uncharacterized membrane protein